MIAGLFNDCHGHDVYMLGCWVLLPWCLAEVVVMTCRDYFDVCVSL